MLSCSRQPIALATNPVLHQHTRHSSMAWLRLCIWNICLWSLSDRVLSAGQRSIAMMTAELLAVLSSRNDYGNAGIEISLLGDQSHIAASHNNNRQCLPQDAKAVDQRSSFVYCWRNGQPHFC